MSGYDLSDLGLELGLGLAPHLEPAEAGAGCELLAQDLGWG